GGRVRHIPRLLYHWRKIPGSGAERYDAKNTDDASRGALMEAVNRTGGGTVERGLRLGTFRVRRKISRQPLVSLVMPCRDKVELTRQCIDSIREKTTWPYYEILIVDNDSSDPATLAYLEQLRDAENCRVFSYKKPYNFSAINNMAAREAGGDFLVFINNDIEVKTGDWLEAMIEVCQHGKVGAVGPMLLYPDNTIQHAGVVLGTGGICNPAFYRTGPEAYSYFNQAHVIRNYSALTGACMMVRKAAFQEMGGFDEVNFPIDYNDIDFCLRLWEKGYRVVYTPFAVLFHHEGATLGYRENPEYDKTKSVIERKLQEAVANPGNERDPEARLMLEKWGKIIADDPFYNPNLARNRFDFSLRLQD
ncbi:MAG: glycosyltransferase family 2 protein, partial [Actinomycetota bacterium]